MGMDLVEFLRARLAKDEQIARACSGALWAATSSGTVNVEGVGGEAVDAGFVASVENEAYGEHIARNDPDRALREVDAKRRIIDDYEKAAWVMDQGHRTEPLEAAQTTRLGVLRLLSLAYAGHPEYQDEWRP